jgi:hypothetical protein
VLARLNQIDGVQSSSASGRTATFSIDTASSLVRNATRPVYEQWAALIGGDLVRRAEAALEELGVVTGSVREAIRAIEARGGAAKVSGAGAATGTGAGPSGHFTTIGTGQRTRRFAAVEQHRVVQRLGTRVVQEVFAEPETHQRLGPEFRWQGLATTNVGPVIAHVVQ